MSKRSYQDILTLAIPNIIAAVFPPLMSLVEAGFVGHLDQVGQLDGLVGASVLFDSGLWLFGFLRMGTIGLTAQAYGAGKFNECLASLVRSLVIATLIGAFLLLCRGPLGHWGLAWTDIAPDAWSSATSYFQIRIWGFPASLMNLCFMGWFIGLGRVRRAMALAIAGSLLNFAGIALLVHGFHGFPKLGVAGAAWASVYSQWILFFLSAGMAIVTMRKILPNADHSLHIWRALLDHKAFGRLHDLNIHLFLRTLAIIFALSAVQIKAAHFGEAYFSAFGLGLRLQIIAAYFIDGFAHATEILVGRTIGRFAADEEQKRAALRNILWKCMVWGGGMAVVMSAVYGAFWKPIFEVLTHHPQVVVSSYDMRPWVLGITLVSSFAYILDGFMIGSTNARAMRNAMWSAVLFGFLPWWGLAGHLGMWALWVSLLALNVIRGCYLGVTAWKMIS